VRLALLYLESKLKVIMEIHRKFFLPYKCSDDTLKPDVITSIELLLDLQSMKILLDTLFVKLVTGVLNVT
jgi:hypothetical protein